MERGWEKRIRVFADQAEQRSQEGKLQRMVHSNDSDELLAKFSAWLELDNLRDEQRFLEECPELLDPENAIQLDMILAKLKEHTDEIQQRLHISPEQVAQTAQEAQEHLVLLDDIWARSRTTEAIREAYVNMYGGLVLDLPSWLNAVVDQLAHFYEIEQPNQTATERAGLLRDALEGARRDARIPYEAIAELYYELGKAQEENVQGERAQRYEAALTAYKAALGTYTLARYPRRYAAIQTGLADVYTDRLIGERSTNLERALACYKEALKVHTPDVFPIDYALTLGNLGGIYQRRIKGERRINLERAIACYEEALQLLTPEKFPAEWAGLQNNFGGAYRERIEGERYANLRRAIAYFEAALQVYTRDAFPLDYAMTQTNLGKTYRNLSTEQWEATTEQAIVCYQAALQIYTRDTVPHEWADIQHDLGLIYAQRLEDERRDNQEQAIAYFTAALQVYTHDAFPVEFASIQHNLGTVYAERVEGEQPRNIERAIESYQAALLVRTLDGFPADHRWTQINLAEAEAARQNWAGAHLAYSRACTAEELLLQLGVGVAGYDSILKERRNAAIYDGFALVRLGRMEDAMLTIEQGRARRLTEALQLNRADPLHISDVGRRRRYQEARQALLAAQAALNTPLSPHLTEHERRRRLLECTEAAVVAMAVFDEVITEIRQAQDPTNFLTDTLDVAGVLRAAECGGIGHTLVYLAATPWGGIAVAAFSANPDLGTSAHVATLDLLALTSELVRRLIEIRVTRNDGIPRLIGGFGHAQQGTGFNWVLHDWEGTTLRERAEALHTVCATAQKGMLDEALQEILTLPTIAVLAHQPLSTLRVDQRALLANTLEHHFLQRELQRCLEILAEAALRPLVAWLIEQGARSLTLIPCGELAAFPLPATLLADGRTVSETLPTSVAPNARSLLSHENTGIKRSGIYAIGDPHPTHQKLPWSEAEAHAIAKLARRMGVPGKTRVQQLAIRDWLISALQEGYIVDASCHGLFDADDFLRSALLLAKGQRLYLGTLLSHEVDLPGLRLLILSACQTAILDLRGARDEVRSLAVGMLQAGAKAILAALWKVDDKAAYLLVVRFAQEWLPKMNNESPAAALARAQLWLRTATNRDLQAWRAADFPEPTVEERRKAGSQQPEHHPWEDTHEQVGTERLIAVRGSRYEAGEAESLVCTAARQHNDPDACPYADSIYWAGFQIVGW